ncbi:hypothetical protein NP493_85g06019 [Ridgeia piscesae]|uniref:Sperm-tail PG-rich repeat-containing protein 2 n=1 Tax=Ridgeia piscesae TaxID=27915 RepID=A0AAD9P8P8_RIDPI|nr:hypothetical protein NP493_85g06019 [Ridgeia piscesae]
MYDRAPRSLTQPQGSTADHVGPGTYDSSFGKKGKADGYAPFSSMTGRESCIYPTDNVIAAPGPGQYDPREPQNYVKGGSTLQSRARRFVPRISETPGPGAYQVDQDLNLRKAVSAPVFQVQPKEKTGTLVLNRIRFHRKPVAPSIPTPGQAYGYEENDDGSLRKQEPPEKDRSIGPAYYKVASDETVTKEIYHGNFFSKMTSKRMEFGGKDGPGPGDYEAYKQPQTVLEHAHIRNPEKTQFESNVPRYNDQIVHDAERMAIPGPGKYNIRGQFDSRAPVVNTEGIEVEHPPFMSQAKRFHTGKTEAPAPGTYNDPRTALEGLRRVTGLKHSPFGQTSVRFQQQGRTKRTPGPGSYNISGMGSESMRKAYIESTRRGVFGSTAMRIQPMMRQHEVELPGPAHYQIKEKPFKPRFQQPTSNFASLSTRIPEHPLPTKVGIVPLCSVKKDKVKTSPQDRSKRFTLYFPDRLVHSDTISASLGSIRPYAIHHCL